MGGGEAGATYACTVTAPGGSPTTPLACAPGTVTPNLTGADVSNSYGFLPIGAQVTYTGAGATTVVATRAGAGFTLAPAVNPAHTYTDATFTLQATADSGIAVPGRWIPGLRAPARRAGVVGAPTGKHARSLTVSVPLIVPTTVPWSSAAPEAACAERHADAGAAEDADAAAGAAFAPAAP